MTMRPKMSKNAPAEIVSVSEILMVRLNVVRTHATSPRVIASVYAGQNGESIIVISEPTMRNILTGTA